MTEFSAVDERGGLHRLVLGATVTVAGAVHARRPYRNPPRAHRVDGYRVALLGHAPDAYSSGGLQVRHIAREDEDVAGPVPPYLGSYVVVTCSTSGDNAPVDADGAGRRHRTGPRALGGPRFSALAGVPAAGRLRGMFLEFRTSDEIRTAALTLHAP